MVSAIGENLNSQMAASGTLGSPAGAIRAAMRFSGASEDIRAQRLNEAQSALGQIGGASIMPSASQFLQVGANKAAQAANIEQQTGQEIYNAHQAHKNQLWGAVGTLGGIAAAPFTGGMSLGMLGGGGGLSSLFGGGSQQQQLNQRYAQGYLPPAAMAGYDPSLGGYDTGNTPFGFGGGGGFNPWTMFASPSYLTGTGY